MGIAPDSEKTRVRKGLGRPRCTPGIGGVRYPNMAGTAVVAAGGSRSDAMPSTAPPAGAADVASEVTRTTVGPRRSGRRRPAAIGAGLVFFLVSREVWSALELPTA